MTDPRPICPIPPDARLTQKQRDVKFIRDTAEACKFFKLADSVWYKRMMKIADRMEGKT